MTKQRRFDLHDYYRRLHAQFGDQHWWPGETAIEICVGAILTQNTAWANVEKAIANLKRARVLSPRVLRRLSEKQIAALIRPSGYFNIKARRLKNFVDFLFAENGGELTRMFDVELPRLRKQLLDVNGIGPETADSILLYAGGKPIVVVDAYTRRVLSRHGLIEASATYDQIQRLFQTGIKKQQVGIYNDFHAQFVAVGKTFCNARVALCEQCPLRPLLPVSSSATRS